MNLGLYQNENSGILIPHEMDFWNHHYDLARVLNDDFDFKGDLQ